MQFDDITYELIQDSSYTKFSFPLHNRYRNMPVYSINNESFFGTYTFIEIPKDVNDKYDQIKPGEEGRWDLMSYKHYQTVNYLWLICLANNVYDPRDSLPAGSVIRIPSKSTINKLDTLYG